MNSRDVGCWLRNKGLFTGAWEILDFWSCTDGDIVTITNRIEDFLPGFELHPLERKRRLMPRELSAEQVDAAEYIEAPNLWKARVGDRILWIGEPRSRPRPIEQILAIVELSENALVSRRNEKFMSDLELHLDWATGNANEGDASAYQEAVGCMRHGLEIVKRLGIPGSISESPWGIG